jgi:hydrogenase maturation factor
MQTRPIKIKAVLLQYESLRIQPDAEALIQYLQSKNLKIGLLCDKSRPSIRRELINSKSIRPSGVDVLIGRDELGAHQNQANAVVLAAETLNLDPDRMLLVSSRHTDLEIGSAAGAATVFLNPNSVTGPHPAVGDYVISTLKDLEKIIRMGLPLPTGKLPNDLLREFLDEFRFDDPSVLINPGIGEDIAAVDVEAEQVLVLKSDPITFATNAIGQYAVLINANDIATSGATPRWLLTTLLFPYGVTPSEIRHVVNELRVSCRRWGISLCGGHTEITDAVSRPVVIGMMAGTVVKSNLIDKRNMDTGDKVLLTKGVAVEGTAIIAREFGDRLKSLGLAHTEIQKCRDFLSNLSIIPEATMAARFKQTSAMHDVTEGGLATALEELSTAGGHRIQINVETIPVFPETGKICRLLDIDPMGLIGSGSLLICCRENEFRNLMAAIRDAGIDVACIGEVKEKGQGIEARKNKKQVNWPCFEVDEITKLF